MLGNKEGALSTMSYLFKSLDGPHAEVDALMVDAEARFLSGRRRRCWASPTS